MSARGTRGEGSATAKGEARGAKRASPAASFGAELSHDDERYDELVRRSSSTKQRKVKKARRPSTRRRRARQPRLEPPPPFVGAPASPVARRAMLVVFAVGDHAADEDRYRRGVSQLRELGAAPAAAAWTPAMTHLCCCGAPRRTFTTLAAIAARCWIVDCSWLRASAFNSDFLGEHRHVVAGAQRRDRPPVFARTVAVAIFSSTLDGTRGLDGASLRSALRLVAIGGGGVGDESLLDVGGKRYKQRVAAFVATQCSAAASPPTPGAAPGGTTEWLILVPDATTERARSRVTSAARALTHALHLAGAGAPGAVSTKRVQYVFDRVWAAPHRFELPHDVALS